MFPSKNITYVSLLFILSISIIVISSKSRRMKSNYTWNPLRNAPEEREGPYPGMHFQDLEDAKNHVFALTIQAIEYVHRTAIRQLTVAKETHPFSFLLTYIVPHPDYFTTVKDLLTTAIYNIKEQYDATLDTATFLDVSFPDLLDDEDGFETELNRLAESYGRH